jgi:DNA-binding winged helix-turn-helix (wHTH) protein
MGEYLLNGKVIFDISSSKLVAIDLDAEKQEIKLDYLESLVLEVLIKNSSNVVSHEQFLSNWRSPEATVNSLFRVISILRSKLKKVGLTEQVILNTPKKGYSLIASVALKSDLEAPLSKIKVLINNKTLSSIFFVLLLLSIFSVYINERNTKSVSIDTEKISYVELLGNTDIKLEMTSNVRNNLIAYSTIVSGDAYWNITVFDRFSDKITILQDDNYNLRKPAWLSENELIYRVYNEKYCKIKIANIDFISESYTSKSIFSCNSESYSSSNAKLNASQILFTDAQVGSKDSTLYIGDLDTGSRKSVDIDNEGGLGIYNVITSPESELVVLLSSIDGVEDKIRLVNPNNGWEIVWSELLKMTNISVGWDGTYLSFKNDNGGISFVEFENNIEVNRTHLPFIVPIHSISSTNNGLIFTSGELITQNIEYTDLITFEKTLLTNSLYGKNKLACFHTQNKILYISNRTGIQQVWLYDLKNKTSKQVSSFKKNHNILNIASSFKHSKIALEFDSKIEIFEFYSENRLSANPIQKIEGINPEFFKDNLIFTKPDESSSSLHSYSLVNSYFSDFNIKGGYTLKPNGDSLYYSKWHSPGVWLYQEGKNDKFILDLPSSAYQWHIDLGQIYYRNDLGDNFIFDIAKGLTTPLSSASCELIINIKLNKCIAVKTTPSANRIILLEW